MLMLMALIGPAQADYAIDLGVDTDGDGFDNCDVYSSGDLQSAIDATTGALNVIYVDGVNTEFNELIVDSLLPGHHDIQLVAGEAVHNNCGALVPGTVQYGGLSGRLFDVDNATLTFANITVSGGVVNGDGGTIHLNLSNLNVNSSTISSGAATGDGGCVFALESTVSMNMSQITGCVAGGEGGGVYIENIATVTDHGLTAVSNSHAGYDLASDAPGLIAQDGGGVRIHGTGASVAIGSLTGNRATGNGAGVAVSEGKVFFTNASVEGNYARLDGGGVYGDLGAWIENRSAASQPPPIDNMYFPPTVGNSTFRNNRAGYDWLGAAIPGSLRRGGAVYIDDATFKSIGAWDQNGVPVYHLFVENLATGSGGGFAFVDGADAELRINEFDANEAENAYGGGGFMEATLDLADLELHGGWFKGNLASVDGGGLRLEGAMSNAEVLKQAADPTILDPGFWDNIVWTIAAPTPVNTQFESNEADHGGGVSLQHAAALQLGARFLGNLADGNGGGLHADGGDLELAGTEFIGNAAHDGGGMWVDNDSASTCDTQPGTCIPASVSFTDNRAVNHGGGLFVASNAFVVSAAAFDGNGSRRDDPATPENESRVTVAGGGAAVVGGDLVLSPGLDPGTTLLQNNRALDGGGVLVSGSTGVLTMMGDVQFTANEAFDEDGVLVCDGGAVLVQNGGTAEIFQGAFNDNEATHDGGAIAITDATLVDVRDGSWENNRATRGGAVSVVDAGGTVTVRLKRGDFTDNLATESGGAVYATNGELTLGLQDELPCPVGQTSCPIDCDAGSPCLRFDNNDAVNNTFLPSVGRGGGLSAEGDVDVTMNRVLMVGNQAVTDGAGVYVDGGGASFDIVNTAIVSSAGHSSTQLAALQVDAGDVDCTHCTLGDNEVGIDVATGAILDLDASVLGEHSGAEIVNAGTLNGTCSVLETAAGLAVLSTASDVDVDETIELVDVSGVPVEDLGPPESLQDQCAVTSSTDLVGAVRPSLVGGLADRGAYELKCVNDNLDPGELCDDGNLENTDGCLNTCEPATCGDGFIYAGVEECDDGNMDNTDDCTNLCENAECGDGYVQGNEECDDGDTDNTDACLNTCENAYCGDGYVQAGVEDCDTADPATSAGCASDCTTVASGNECTENSDCAGYSSSTLNGAEHVREGFDTCVNGYCVEAEIDEANPMECDDDGDCPLPGCNLMDLPSCANLHLRL